jgi:hypothetical protein
MARYLTALLFTAIASLSFSQSGAPVEMADLFRSSGKIYVVIIVISVIFTGIILFLIRLDRKISRLEKEAKK